VAYDNVVAWILFGELVNGVLHEFLTLGSVRTMPSTSLITPFKRFTKPPAMAPKAPAVPADPTGMTGMDMLLFNLTLVKIHGITQHLLLAKDCAKTTTLHSLRLLFFR
jgi:hypothetical protein